MIRELVEQGTVYAGWSAGAGMASPTLRYFDLLDDTSEAPEVIWEGLGLTDVVVGDESLSGALKYATAGVPGLQTSEFELVPIDPAEDWYGVRIPQEHLFELLRTPAYGTWQEERWLFCCKRPMTYVGEWANVLKSPRPPGDARAFFEQILDPGEASKDWLWDAITRGSGSVGLYVFHCKACGRYRAN